MAEPFSDVELAHVRTNHAADSQTQRLLATMDALDHEWRQEYARCVRERDEATVQRDHEMARYHEEIEKDLTRGYWTQLEADKSVLEARLKLADVAIEQMIDHHGFDVDHNPIRGLDGCELCSALDAYKAVTDV